MPSVSVPVIAAGVGAAGSIGGALISSSDAQSAAGTQAAAADQASANALQQYQQTRADLAPFRSIGTAAVGGLSNILTVPQTYTDPANGGNVTVNLPTGSTFAPVAGPDGSRGWAVIDANGNQSAFYPGDLQGAAQLLSAAQPAFSPTYQPPSDVANILAHPGFNPSSDVANVLAHPAFNPTQADLEATPGYQFNLTQGLQAVQNSNAAKGLGVSGAALKGAANYAVGLADNTLQTQAGIFNQNYTRALTQADLFNQQFQRAQSAAGIGSDIFQRNFSNIINPLQSLASLGENAGAQAGQLGVQGINNANQALIGGANALAAGQVGGANALSGGLAGLGNSATNYLLLSQLMGGGGGGFGNAVYNAGGAGWTGVGTGNANSY